MKSQSLAASNPHLYDVVRSVLTEVMTGVARERSTDQVYDINFRVLTVGRNPKRTKLVAEVFTKKGCYDCGTWEIVVRAM